MGLSMNKFKKIGLLILNILIITTSSIFIFQSEKFQEKIAPKKYWQNKVKTLESELKKDYVKIKELELGLEKENALYPFSKEEAKLKSEEINKNIDEVFTKIEKEHTMKVNEIKNEINNLTKEQGEIKKDLDLALNQTKILK